MAKGMCDGDQRFVDLSPGLMALLDQLVLKHNFDTDHLFVVLKKTAKDKRGRITYGRPLNRHAVKAMFQHYSRKNQLPLHAHMTAAHSCDGVDPSRLGRQLRAETSGRRASSKHHDLLTSRQRRHGKEVAAFSGDAS